MLGRWCSRRGSRPPWDGVANPPTQVAHLEEQLVGKKTVEERLNAEILALQARIEQLEEQLRTSAEKTALLENRVRWAREDKEALESRVEGHEGGMGESGELTEERRKVSRTRRRGKGADGSQYRSRVWKRRWRSYAQSWRSRGRRSFRYSEQWTLEFWVSYNR